jgi:hypothetical protein
MAQDIFASLRSYASKLSNGEKSAAEVSAALTSWAKESGEGIKDRVEVEIESALLKMGFLRKKDIAPLIKRIDELERSAGLKGSSPKKSVKKSAKKSSVSRSVKGK